MSTWQSSWRELSSSAFGGLANGGDDDWQPVRGATDRRQTPMTDASETPLCRCEKGWVCEAHPDERPGHAGCDVQDHTECQQPQCPYWQGDDPIALDPDVQGMQSFICARPIRRHGPES